jgi:hypothetical protein
MFKPLTAVLLGANVALGAGWLINVGQGFEARLVVGIPLLNGPLSSTGSVRAYFNVGYQF